MKTKLFYFFCVFFIQSIILGQGTGINILIDKNEFLYNEPIYAIITLKNISDKIIKIPPYYTQITSPNILIEFEDARGNKLTPKFGENTDIKYIGKNILPNETVTDFFPISTIYGMKDNPISGGAYGLDFYSLPIGKYKLKINYVDKGANISIVSNIVEISINEMTNDEDKIVFNRLSEIASEYRENLNSQMITNLTNIISDTLDSNFKQFAYGKLIITSYLNGDDKFKEYLRELIIKYPDNVYTFVILMFFWDSKEIFNEQLVREKIKSSIYYDSFVHIINNSNLFK